MNRLGASCFRNSVSVWKGTLGSLKRHVFAQKIVGHFLNEIGSSGDGLVVHLPLSRKGNEENEWF